MTATPPPPEYRAELSRKAASAPLRDWIIRFFVITALLTTASGIVGKMRRGDAPPAAPGVPAAPIKGAPAG